MNQSNQATVTKHRIGKTTYLVTAAPSGKATDTIQKKMEKVILKDMRGNAVIRPFLIQE